MRTEYTGKDSEGNAIYVQKKLPTVKAIGLEKINGTQASIHFNNLDGFWAQSKEQIITPEKDNAGSAFAAQQRKEEWITIVKDLADFYNIDLDKYIISIFYEWCGIGIQKHTAVEGLEKRAMIFQHFKCSPIEHTDQEDEEEEEEEEAAKWLSTLATTRNESVLIFNLCDFPLYELEVDFNSPGIAQNKMLELLEKIEDNSPVGQQFGFKGNTAEGIVFTFEHENTVYRWKVKGEKHSKSKVKTLKPVDNEKEQLKQDCAQKITPGWRLEQMYDLANDTINSGVPDIKNIGLFIKMVNQDIIKEDSDIIVEFGLEPKDIFSNVARIIKAWYFEQLNSFSGL